MTDIKTIAADLLPCPFCGSATAPRAQKLVFNDSWIGTCSDSFEGCGVNTAAYDDKSEVIAAWNRRASLAATEPSLREVEAQRDHYAGRLIFIQTGLRALIENCEQWCKYGRDCRHTCDQPRAFLDSDPCPRCHKAGGHREGCELS